MNQWRTPYMFIKKYINDFFRDKENTQILVGEVWGIVAEEYDAYNDSEMELEIDLAIRRFCRNCHSTGPNKKYRVRSRDMGKRTWLRPYQYYDVIMRR